MWNNLPFDILANILSYLPPESFARAKSVCRNWNVASSLSSFSSPRDHPPWLVAFPTRSRDISCYVHNPVRQKWHLLPFDHMITCPIRPIATLNNNGLVLLKVTTTTSLQLAICNPFTKQFKSLSRLNVTRINPAVGLVTRDLNSVYNIYVAGGMSKADSGGATYQSTIEMYDSFRDRWEVVGAMPVEFAVRLTVWTPNESVCARGVLYWMTSARAYSVMGFEIETSKWRELSVPMGDRLEFAALVPRMGNLAMVGGLCSEGVCIWEYGEENSVWNVIEKVPFELVNRLLGNKANWSCVKCVGIDKAVCLYIDLGSGFIVWKEVVFGERKWEWFWIEGCWEIQNLPVKGLLLHPNPVS